jgi:hypothetical protein
VSASARSYTWTGRAPDTYICSRVRAYNSAGYSAWSGTVCATTLPLAPAVPAVPSGVSATALSSSQVQISWSENSNQTGFQVTDGRATVNVSASARSYTWTGRAPDTYICSRVRAYNSAGYSAWSGTVCATTQSLIPAAPGNPTVVALSSSEIRITWTEDSNQTGFLVSNFLENVEVGPDVRSYTWTGLAPDSWSCYKVQAFNAAGYSDWSDVAWGQQCTTTLPLAPATPGDISAFGLSSSQIQVSWTKDPNQTGIEVTDGVTIIDVGDDATYTWTDLAPATSKCTSVRAYNAGGYSDWSSTACATTLLPGVALNVPYLRQWQGLPSSNEDCGPTSVAMVVWYFNQRPAGLTDKGFVADVRATIGGVSGTSSDQLVAALQHYGLTGHKIGRPSHDEQISQIRSAVASGQPVIAFVGGKELGRGDNYGSHWIVVRGFSSDGTVFYVNDPDSSYGGRITLDTSTLGAALDGAELGSSSIIVDIP